MAQNCSCVRQQRGAWGDFSASYKVTFINSDTAIMTHGTKGADAHYSLHVWSRKGGTWQIVATSTTPVASGK